MRQSIRVLTAFIAGNLLMAFLPAMAAADGPQDQSPDKASQDVPTHSLLSAMDKGLVGVRAEGIGDGRMTMSVTNRTNRPLRVILPPGIVVQGATGQMGGMGGMGGGMGGGGMGGRGGGGRGGGGMGGVGRAGGGMACGLVGRRG